MPVKVPAGEELNTTKLDDLKAALDDLKIVDISRKPAGLSTDLKAAATGVTAPDVTQVYKNLLAASQRHLAAFGG